MKRLKSVRQTIEDTDLLCFDLNLLIDQYHSGENSSYKTSINNHLIKSEVASSLQECQKLCLNEKNCLYSTFMTKNPVSKIHPNCHLFKHIDVNCVRNSTVHISNTYTSHPLESILIRFNRYLLNFLTEFFV